jgi:hypothetical protein
LPDSNRETETNTNVDVDLTTMSMDDTPPPRASRFREHTNTTSSIRPPPDELWKDLGIEVLIDQFNQENSAPPVRRAHTSVHAMPAPNPHQEAMDARKLAAEQAYHEAKELGLLPAPKVFVRPAMAARARTSGK